MPAKKVGVITLSTLIFLRSRDREGPRRHDAPVALVHLTRLLPCGSRFCL
jgi:hypothetical protein